ncbi:hypothetical protein [Micromonospora sp. NPDC005173]
MGCAAASARLLAGLSLRDVERFTTKLELLMDRFATGGAPGAEG